VTTTALAGQDGDKVYGSGKIKREMLLLIVSIPTLDCSFDSSMFFRGLFWLSLLCASTFLALSLKVAIFESLSQQTTHWERKHTIGTEPLPIGPNVPTHFFFCDLWTDKNHAFF
jgi:hypothetical protein